MPTRVMVATVVLTVFFGLAVWGIAAAARATQWTLARRFLGGASVVLGLALLAAWVVFVWPAYWD